MVIWLFWVLGTWFLALGSGLQLNTQHPAPSTQQAQSTKHKEQTSNHLTI